jgi:hypothetical protein
MGVEPAIEEEPIIEQELIAQELFAQDIVNNNKSVIFILLYIDIIFGNQFYREPQVLKCRRWRH